MVFLLIVMSCIKLYPIICITQFNSPFYTDFRFIWFLIVNFKKLLCTTAFVMAPQNFTPKNKTPVVLYGIVLFASFDPCLILREANATLKDKHTLLDPLDRYPRGGGGGDGGPKNLIRGGVAPKSGPLPFYVPFLIEKIPLLYTFYYQMVSLWHTSLRTPAL